MSDTPVEVQFTSAGCLNYPCRTPPQHKLDDSLEQLVDVELMYRRGRLPDAEYTFKHSLVQDAAYSTLLRARRHDLHRRIARAIEVRFPERIENEPELLAYHCTEAGLTELAVEYWLKAGQQAMARSAMNEVVSRLRKGLQLLSNVPESIKSQRQELDHRSL